MPEISSRGPLRYGFMLLPQYSMIAFSSALEPLRLANRLSGKSLYEWQLLSCNGEAVAASNGLRVEPMRACTESTELDGVFVCGGVDIKQATDRTVLFWIRKLANRRVPLGALCTGCYVLAKADVLDGYRCTIHWENLASMREEFPQIVLSSELFEVDRDRYTCAGGTAALDMMLHLIAGQQGSEMAARVSEACVVERIRGRHDRQRIPLKHRLGTSQPKLMKAVTLMEANLEEPIGLDELAGYVGLSRRQLERLFQKYLDCVPTRYYLQLRLARARQLLLQTEMSIFDVAFACGFVSAPHFSKCYRDFFGAPPRDERRLRKGRHDEPAETQHRGV
jgi:transcriptional regulator GlxA family with amidase domain